MLSCIKSRMFLVYRSSMMYQLENRTKSSCSPCRVSTMATDLRLTVNVSESSSAIWTVVRGSQPVVGRVGETTVQGYATISVVPMRHRAFCLASLLLVVLAPVFRDCALDGWSQSTQIRAKAALFAAANHVR